MNESPTKRVQGKGTFNSMEINDLKVYYESSCHGMQQTTNMLSQVYSLVRERKAKALSQYTEFKIN
jgi:hypothetical protein